MGTIITRFESPVNETTGLRDVMHPETEIDAVLDPVTGISLPDRLKNIENKLVPATEEKEGFMTPKLLQQINRVITNEVVTSKIRPTFSDGGYWFEIYDPPAVQA